MKLNTKLVPSLLVVGLCMFSLLSMGRSIAHAENVSGENRVTVSENKDSLILNAMTDQEKKELENLLASGNLGAASQLLAGAIYGIAFGTIIHDRKGVMEGGAYEKEFNENIQWFKETPQEEWTHQGLKAFYLKNPNKTTKTVVLVHGFSSMPSNMGPWAKIYFDLGYNILTPELRGHGSNKEDRRSLGWKDKDDIVEWTKFLNKKNESADSEIILSGVSMGASAVMMSSAAGLPSNIKAIIEDCGYTEVGEEMKVLINEIPLIPTIMKVNIYNELDKILLKKQGFTLEEASAIKQISQSTIPLLLIHGDNDKAVPTKMAQELYDAAGGEKELVLIKGADHPKAILYDLPLYSSKVSSFLTRTTNH